MHTVDVLPWEDGAVLVKVETKGHGSHVSNSLALLLHLATMLCDSTVAASMTSNHHHHHSLLKTTIATRMRGVDMCEANGCAHMCPENSINSFILVNI